MQLQHDARYVYDRIYDATYEYITRYVYDIVVIMVQWMMSSCYNIIEYDSLDLRLALSPRFTSWWEVMLESQAGRGLEIRLTCSWAS